MMRETEEKLKTMERSKFDEFKRQLQDQIAETEQQRKIEYDRRMQELISQRESQLQHFTHDMHRKLQDEYRDKYLNEERKFHEVQRTYQAPRYETTSPTRPEGYVPGDVARHGEGMRGSYDSMGSGMTYSDNRSPYGDTQILRRHEETKMAVQNYQQAVQMQHSPGQ